MIFASNYVLDKPFLVFVACWGSGKTLLMITKAKELNASGEKVLILVFLNGKELEEGQKSLLILDLEEKLKEYENVTVKGVRYMEWKENDPSDTASYAPSGYSMKDVDGNDLSTDGYEHIFVDEYFEDLIKLNKDAIKKFKELIEGKKTVWVCFSNSYNKHTVPRIGSDPSEYKFANYYKLIHNYIRPL